VIRNQTPPVLCYENENPITGDTLTNLTLGSDFYGNATAYIYVPDDAVNTYKTDVSFSKLEDKIKPLSEYEAGVVNGSFI